MQQQHERPVLAELSVDEGERELHEHGRHEREEQRESLPEVVGAVGGAQVERRRGLGREQGHRHQDGRGESHPHSHSAIRGGKRGRHAHNGPLVPVLEGSGGENRGCVWKSVGYRAATAATPPPPPLPQLVCSRPARGWDVLTARCSSPARLQGAIEARGDAAG